MGFAYRFSVRFVIGLATVSLVATAGSVRADWSDNFNGGLQQTWQFATVEGSATFTAGSVNDRLQLKDSRSPDLGGAITAFGVVVATNPASNPSFTDVRMTAIVNPDHDPFVNDSLMLMVRGNLLNQSFYALEIDYGGSFGQSNLIIYRNGGSGNSNLATVEIPDLQWEDSLYAEIEAIGTNLKARLYDAPGGTLRASAYASDADLSSGLSGVLATVNDFRDSPVNGIWDDVTSESIVGGDYNDDRVVDAADFTVWRDNVGMPAGTLPNDPTDPLFGDIGIEQYLVWKENFGSAASGLTAVAVPEPTASALVLGFLVVALALRRK